MLIENIQHNPASSKSVNTRHSPAIKPPSKGYFRTAEQEAWVDLIDRYSPYEWFCTLTFKNHLHTDQVNKRFHIWIREINNKLYGGNYRSKGQGVSWVKSLEHQARGCLHIHALIGSPELYKLSIAEFKYKWKINCGRKVSQAVDPLRFDRVLPKPSRLDYLKNGIPEIDKYDPLLGGKNYVAKYVTKGADNIDMYVSPTLLNLVNNKEQGRLALHN